MSGGGPSRTCPRCGMTTYHPDDVQEGYCGACHDWTTTWDELMAWAESLSGDRGGAGRAPGVRRK